MLVNIRLRLCYITNENEYIHLSRTSEARHYPKHVTNTSIPQTPVLIPYTENSYFIAENFLTMIIMTVWKGSIFHAIRSIHAIIVINNIIY